MGRGFNRLASCDGLLTTGVVRAARGAVDGAWAFCSVGIGGEIPVKAVDPWGRLQQHLRVRVLWGSKQIVNRLLLDQLAQIQNPCPVRDLPNNSQIVGDEKIGQVQFCLQIAQQIQHLRLYRYVERRRWFITDDDFRLTGQNAGDTDPLALTT